MKRNTKIIDTSDDLHEAIERVVAGLSPQERAQKLIEMFGHKGSAPPAPSEPETEADGIRAESIRRERVRRLMAPRESKAPRPPTKGSSE